MTFRRYGRGVPRLLRYQAPGSRHRRHCLEIEPGVTPGNEFIMATLSRKQRPSSSTATTVERGPIIVLTVSITIIAMPHGPIRCVHLKQCIGHRDTVADRRIVSATQTEANKLHEINAYLFVGRHQAGVASVLDLQDFLH